jgi:hypothetical protein
MECFFAFYPSISLNPSLTLYNKNERRNKSFGIPDDLKFKFGKKQKLREAKTSSENRSKPWRGRGKDCSEENSSECEMRKWDKYLN